MTLLTVIKVNSSMPSRAVEWRPHWQRDCRVRFREFERGAILREHHISHPSLPAVGWLPVDDWTLLEGLQVEIFRQGRLLDQGTVECVTSDGTLLWLKQNGATQRRIAENLPGTYVRLILVD